MSTNTNTTTRGYTRYGVTIDRHSLILALLFLLVTGAAVGLAVNLSAAGETVETPGDVEGASAGAGWALLEVGVAILLLGAIALYNRVPEWVQELIRWNAFLGIALYMGYRSAYAGRSVPFMLAYYLGLLSVAKAVDELGLWWIPNNVGALFIAILAGAGLGLALDPIALAVALGILTVYDHVFADRQTWMFSLLGAMLKARIPVLFIWPTTWRFDWEEAFGLDEDDEADADTEAVETDESDADAVNTEPDEIGWGIGMADLMIPAGFAAAVAVRSPPPLTDATSLVVAGVVVGLLVACFRLRYKMEHAGSGAGLPAIATGVLGGWLVALALTTLATTLGNTVVVG